jgi:hypothetical protein
VIPLPETSRSRILLEEVQQESAKFEENANWSQMARFPFSPNNPDLEAVRQIVFERLRAEPNWNQLDYNGTGYAPYVQYVGSELDGRNALIFAAQEVFWQLLVEGILSPGINSNNLNLPWFHVTRYGAEVLRAGPGNPHDPTGYFRRLYEKVPQPDQTVLVYLTESVNSFRHGDRVASTVMLGIAAERVFLLVCEALAGALTSPTEQKVFGKLLSSFPMNPKLQWVHQKIQSIRAPGFPESANIVVTAIYDLMRTQRNELGHPREQPPTVTQEDAFVNLQVFPRYYQTAEDLRQFLAMNKV